MNGIYPAMRSRRSRGFTLIELMTALAVIALLAAMAVPTMRSVIENGRIRAAGTSIQNGLALARAEAVRLNTQVEFELTEDGWEVRRVAGGEVLHQAAGMEASGSGLTVADAGGATSVVYNAFGRAGTVDSITRIDIGAANPSGSANYKPLAVQVLPGGTVRLCDPRPEADDTRSCL